jgi:cytochrome c-type protein NapC
VANLIPATTHGPTTATPDDDRAVRTIVRPTRLRDGTVISKKIKYLAALIIAIPLVVLASWIVTETMVQETAGEEFCGSCHTMTPMIAAYRDDVHGGNHPQGVRARCTQCHIPDDNVFVYILAKARFGLHDAWAQLTYDTDAIDWQAKRAHREMYVFDSACLGCHQEVESATMSQPAAFIAHRPYFLGETQMKCVSCHPHVGHLHLTRYLPEPKVGDQL